MKVKALRRKYVQWLEIMSHVQLPKGSRLISFRVWRRRAVRA